jgi:hypothetical protein
MAVIVDHLYEMTLKASNGGAALYNVYQYRCDAAGVGTDGAELGEAWWNHISATTRALFVSAWGPVFDSVTARDLSDPAGLYGEFGIPSGEKTGTRSAPSASQWLPTFNAVGVRLAVGERATRPGQKRLACLAEEDVVGQDIQSAMMALVTSWANVITNPMVFGSPAALVSFVPVVVRKDITGAPVAHQDVTGYVINSRATSQVSRKYGRGL